MRAFENPLAHFSYSNPRPSSLMDLPSDWKSVSRGLLVAMASSSAASVAEVYQQIAMPGIVRGSRMLLCRQKRVATIECSLAGTGPCQKEELKGETFWMDGELSCGNTLKL